jgi:hypothetical protein
MDITTDAACAVNAYGPKAVLAAFAAVRASHATLVVHLDSTSGRVILSGGHGYDESMMRMVWSQFQEAVLCNLVAPTRVGAAANAGDILLSAMASLSL